MDLLPLSLEGIFLEMYDLYVNVHLDEEMYDPYEDVDLDESQEFTMPVLFSRPSTGRKIPIDIGYPHNVNTSNTGEYERLILDYCNGLLLLRHNRVVNPATQQWAELPPVPEPCMVATDCHGCSYSKYLVFDPTVSPHYEVFLIPEIPYKISTGHICKHPCKDKPVSEMEWPPTPYIMDVFSSRVGGWEERSFFRKGKAVGTVSDCKPATHLNRLAQGAAYWHGALYINCEDDFVLRYTYPHLKHLTHL
jgi:hypothetical protein